MITILIIVGIILAGVAGDMLVDGWKKCNRAAQNDEQMQKENEALMYILFTPRR